jgi:CheY-like chemotaxis protein
MGDVASCRTSHCIVPRDVHRMTGGHTPHVMIIEDDSDTREVVRLILEMEGMRISEAADGADALDRLHELRAKDPSYPCVILLDVMMPRCSGPDFRRRQLADPLLAGVPVIVLSAVADHSAMSELDVFASLSKPFDPDELVRVVRRACYMQQHNHLRDDGTVTEDGQRNNTR